MKFSHICTLAALALSVLSLVSCETVESGPKPTGDRLSSMPHNMPAPWEGQAGMPGMMSGQY
ncbi:MAG: hypothetical protein QE273_07265 [Verrucomicrobiales bacterium]|jgi:hypothetical protein|nr:hypothetical protein [Verrucomicrobiales bacterium]